MPGPPAEHPDWLARHRVLLRVGGSFSLALGLMTAGWILSEWRVAMTGVFVQFLLAGLFAADFADFYVTVHGAPNVFAPFGRTDAKWFFRVMGALSVPWYVWFLLSLPS